MAVDLRVLGSPDLLDGNGKRLHSVVVQPKRFGLLVFLALSRPAGFHQRDELLALFWPDQSEERARNALNQALSFLRRSLGPDVILSRGPDEVGVDLKLLSCDALACLDAADRGDEEGVLARYVGELLPAFHVEDAPAFGDWIDQQRRVVRDRAAAAAQVLSVRADSRGDFSRAIDWAIRGVALAPCDETLVRQLVLVHDRSGNPGRAIQAYDEYAARLSRELDLEPSAELGALVGEICSRSANARPASARAVDRPPSAEAVVRPLDAMVPPAGGSTSTTGRRSRGRLVALGVIAAAIVVSVTLIVARTRFAPMTGFSGDASASRVIAVLPFVNVGGDSANEAAADGIADDIRTALTKVGLSVVPRGSAFAFKGTAAPPSEIGHKLHVASYVTGTLQRSGDALRITAELIDVATGTQVWSDKLSGARADLFRLQDSIAASVATGLHVTIDRPARAAMTGAGTTDVEAHALFQQATLLKGRYTERDLRRAIELYEQAAARDPHYADPLAGEADAWFNLSDDWEAPRVAVAKGKAAALRALERDSTNAAAHAALGEAYLFTEWKFAQADTEFRRAIALDPRNARATIHLGGLFFWRGNRDSAFAAWSRAATFDPWFAPNLLGVVGSWIKAGRADSAERVINRLSEVDPSHAWLHPVLGSLRLLQGKNAEALIELQQSDTTQTRVLAGLAVCEARMGKTADARRHLAALEAIRKQRYVAADDIARIWANLGELDTAFRWMDQAVADHSAWLIGLDGQDFDPLRGDSRFKAIKAKMGWGSPP